MLRLFSFRFPMIRLSFAKLLRFPFATIKVSTPVPPLSSSDSEDSSLLSDPKHIYVSKHYKEIDNELIVSTLEKFKLEHKRYASGQIAVKYCPFCPKPHNFQRDNQYTLNLKGNSGAFFCFRCGVKGSWLDFKNMLYNGTQDSKQLFDYRGIISQVGSPIGEQIEPKLANESLSFLHRKNLESKSTEFAPIIEYLIGTGPESRQLTMDTLRKYKIGIGFESFANEEGNFVDVPVIFFPLFVPRSKKAKQKILAQKMQFDSSSISTLDYQLVRNKLRGAGKDLKTYQRMDPTPGQWGIFGLNTIDPQSKEIIITEGEFDAMAVNQTTGRPAISLPNGANHLPVQILPFLEKFEKIILWMDADEVGQGNARKFAEKLGVNRTFIVNSRLLDPEGPKDANDALRLDPRSLDKYLATARALSQENITTFSEMKSAVYSKILKFEESQGLKSRTLPWINRKLKGFRRGEFTIYSGLTGSGKTTLLSQLSIDFCKQGVATLWGSFEIKNEVLMTHMMLQFSEANLVKEPKSFEYYANQFENLPMYFMKFFGSSQLDQIISTIEFALYTYDISHVVIDNLQFLLSGQGRGFEKFDLQDEAVSRFRKLATAKNVHVSLVIHPRKVDDTQEINMSSIFGTAKSTQEADNVFLIQNHKGYKVLELKKNRFDGEVGSIALGFDKETKRYFELYQNEVVDLENEKIKISDIVARLRKKDSNGPNSEAEMSPAELLKSNETSGKKGKTSNYKKDKTSPQYNKLQNEEEKFQNKFENEVQNTTESTINAPTPEKQPLKTLNSKPNEEKVLKPEKIEEGSNKTRENREDDVAIAEKMLNSLLSPNAQSDGNSIIASIKAEAEMQKIIKEASGISNPPQKEISLDNERILEERKKNLMKYIPVEKPENMSFYDEDYKPPKTDEIEELINNTIKRYGKKNK